MREQREPWLRLPDKVPGGDGERRLDPRFRTHIVAIQRQVPSPVEAPPPQPSSRPLPAPTPPQTVLTLGAPDPVAIERAAAEAAIPKPAAARASRSPVRRGAEPVLSAAGSRPTARHSETRAPPLGLHELPAVSSADWAAKVGEAAKIVDVVVVFYTSAHLGSDMFRLAFQTVVNEVLPRAALVERAWAIAREIAAKPTLHLRYSRVVFTEYIKRHMQDLLGYGLALEGMALMEKPLPPERA